MRNINMLPKIEQLKLEAENTFYKKVKQLIIVTIIGLVIYICLSLYNYKCQRHIDMENLRKLEIEKILQETLNLPTKKLKDIKIYNQEIYSLLYNKKKNISSYIKSFETSKIDHMWLEEIDYNVDSFMISGLSISGEDLSGKNLSAEERIYEFENKLKNSKFYKKVTLLSLEDSGKIIKTDKKGKRIILDTKKFKYKLFL